MRGYMNRVKEIQDKAKAPKVNAGAAKRMVKSALWQAAQKKVEQQGRGETSHMFLASYLAGAKPVIDWSQLHSLSQI